MQYLSVLFGILAFNAGLSIQPVYADSPSSKAYATIEKRGDVLPIVAVLTYGKDPKTAMIEAGLMELLGGSNGFVFVERARLDLLLKEMTIVRQDGTDAQFTSHIGALLGADALVFIESQAATSEVPIRVITSDVHTGSRLGDLFVPHAVSSSDLALVAGKVGGAVRKLMAPVQGRHYIGIIGLTNEEPGRYLDPYVEELTRLLEHDLTVADDVIVLERSCLNRLMDERSLVGTDGVIRQSAFLLSGGIKRDIGRRILVATIRLADLARGSSRIIQISAPPEDLNELRTKLVAGIREAIGLPAGATVQAAVETGMLLEGARRLLQAGQEGRALAMAEASLAMQFTPEAALFACELAFELSRPTSLANIQRLRFGLKACQYNRMAVEYLSEKNACSQEGVFSIVENLEWNAGIISHAPVPGGLVPEESELRAEMIACNTAALTRALKHFVDDNANQLVYWFDWADRIAASPENLADIVEKTVMRMENGIISKHGYSPAKRSLSGLYNLVIRLPPEKGAPLFKWLRDRPEPRYQLLGWLGELRGNDPVAQQRAAVAIARISPDSDYFILPKGHLNLGPSVIDKTCEILGPRLVVSCIDVLVGGSERQGGAIELLRIHDPLMRMMQEASADERRTCVPRILAVLKTADPVIQSDPPTHDRWTAFVRECEEYLAASQHPASLTAEPDIGEWSKFEINTIPVDARAIPAGSIVYVHSEESGEPVDTVVVWALNGCQSNVFTLVNKQNGQITEIGRMLGPAPALHASGGDLPTRIIDGRQAGCSVRLRDRFYFGGGAGLVIVENGHVDVLTEKDGLPSDAISHMVLCAGVLLLVHPGAISRFDPETRLITVLASDRSVLARNELDGKSWRMGDLIVDGTGRRAWLALRGRDAVTGVWVCDPMEESFARVCPGASGFIDRFYREDQRIMCRRGHYVYECTINSEKPSFMSFIKKGYLESLGPYETSHGYIISRYRHLGSFTRSSTLPLPTPPWSIVVRSGQNIIATGATFWTNRVNTLWNVNYKGE